MGRLTFDPETHTYAVDGNVLPSVTQIIRDAGLYPWGNDSTDANYYMERGLAVHAACRYWDEGRLDPHEELDPEVEPRLDAYKKFLKDSGARVLMNETPMYHPAMRYAGTLDRLFVWNNDLWLVDLKAGGHVPAYCVQTAAYLDMLQSIPLGIDLYEKLAGWDRLQVLRAGLHLAGDGTYKVEMHADHTDISTFRHALGLYFWKRRNLT